MFDCNLAFASVMLLKAPRMNSEHGADHEVDIRGYAPRVTVRVLASDHIANQVAAVLAGAS